jgi:hypothetical protein
MFFVHIAGALYLSDMMEGASLETVAAKARVPNIFGQVKD